MIDRERKVDVEKLTPEQADSLSVQLGEKIKEINDKTITEINRYLIVYGMEAKSQIVIGKLGEFDEKVEIPKKLKKPRKKKEANLS